MKFYKSMGLVLFAGVLVLGGCGNKDNKVVDGNKDDPMFTTEAEVEGGSLESGDGYGFSEFDLEIKVDGADTIDLDYKVKDKADTDIKAEYENKIENFDLKDEDALNEMRELFIAILITKDTPPEEVKDEILKFLHIEDYSKFELDVLFDDGVKLEIDDEK